MKTLPGVTENMLHENYWIEYIKNCGATYDEASRDACNQAVTRTSKALTNIVRLASEICAASSSSEIARLHILPAKRDSRDLYDETGEPIGESFWTTVETQCASEVTDHYVRPGFTVRRTDVRTWPNEKKAFKTAYDREFDQFQETALHTFEPVIVLSQSVDGSWLLVQAVTYQGWVRRSDVALCDWDTFENHAGFTHANRFIVATGPFVTTQAQPYESATSKQPVEFGSYIPLDTAVGEALGNQTDVGHFRVKWPVRGEDGELRILPAYVSQMAQVAEGFLDFTRENLVRAAFSLLSERYGWGDSFGCHDCSSYVMDVYRTLGVQLPRNADAQEESHPARVVFPKEATFAEREEILSTLHTGDPLYMPGHTMIYLGKVDGRHYMIHDFAGYAEEVDGVTREVPVNEIMVSTLDILTRSGQTYLDALTSGLHLFKLS